MADGSAIAMELLRRRSCRPVALFVCLTVCISVMLLLFYRPQLQPNTHTSRVTKTSSRSTLQLTALHTRPIVDIQQSHSQSLVNTQQVDKVNPKQTLQQKPSSPHTHTTQQSTTEIHTESLYVSSSMPLGSALKLKYNSNQSAIVEAIRHAWSGYRQYSWGQDELRPVSRTASKPSFGLGMTLIDCLDTLWLVGMQEEFNEARQWVADHLNIENNNQFVSLFETNIRVLGGLLSAYHLSLDKLFLEKAILLGERLLQAFHTLSGIPGPIVNLQSGLKRERGGRVRALSVAEAGTLQLEFRDLSRASGNASFQYACDKTSDVLLDQGGGKMLSSIVNPNTGQLQATPFSVGAGIDSYYEYLLKQWLQSTKTENKFLTAYKSTVKDVTTNLVAKSTPSNFTFIGKAMRRGSPPYGWMDHLSCFYPGMLTLGLMNELHPEQRELASRLVHTCVTAYSTTPSGLAPDVFHFNTAGGERDFILGGVPSIDMSNILRPETVESLFYQYRLTKDTKYRDWGWQIFQAFEHYTKIATGGYSSVWTVMDPSKKQDKMESFFVSETLKYLFLLFTDDPDILRLDEWVFNTEGHPLPIWSHKLSH